MRMSFICFYLDLLCIKFKDIKNKILYNNISYNVFMKKSIV